MQKWMFALLVLAVPDVWAVSSTRIESLFPHCGTYEVTGKVECQGAACSLVFFPGSRSELKADLQVKDPQIIRNHFQNKNIRIQVSYSGPSPFVLKSLEAVPRRSSPRHAASAIQLQEEEECHAKP